MAVLVGHKAHAALTLNPSESLGVDCQGHLEGRHVLAISDSSEINRQAHRGRLMPEGVGVVGNNQAVGFFIHPTLVVTIPILGSRWRGPRG